MKVKVGDITKIRTGKLDANASSVDGEYPFFTCSREPLRISSYTYDCECVLVAGNGDLNVKYYNGKFDAYQRTYIIEDNSNGKLHMPYLYLYMEKYVEELRSLSIGGVIKYVKLGNLTDAKIELPPIDVQKSIVGVLSKTKRIIDERNIVLNKLDELIKARFVEMFGDFKINSKNWPVVGFDDIAIIDGNMTTDYDKYADYPHIGIDSIEKDTGLLKGYRTVSEDGVISGKYVFNSKHIIYSKIRPNLNKVSLPNFEGLCSADAYPILPIEEKCTRVFLAYDMRSPFFLDYILQFCKRTNLPKVNRKEVSGFKTPLPPLKLQIEFSEFVQQVDKSKSVVQKSLEGAQLLFDSLMQKYFG